MATTVNYGWLKDKNNNKFAPKTLSSQIVTNEGKSFEDEIKQQISSVSTSTNGIIVTITTDGWNLQSDGTYKKIITITELTGNETLDMCLYPGDTHTQEQIIAYCEKITSVDIEAGKLILIASEALTVSFRVFLYGKIDIDEDSIVALNDNVLEVKTVTQEYYNSLPESEKAKGIYITDGDDLTAKNIYYDGSETGLGNTVQGAIDKLNSNLSNMRYSSETDTIQCLFNGEWVDVMSAGIQKYVFKNTDFGLYAYKGKTDLTDTVNLGKPTISNISSDGTAFTVTGITKQLYNSFGCIFTTEKFDLTNKSKIKIKYTATMNAGTIALRITDSVINNYNIEKYLDINKNVSECKLDISDLTGEHFIGLSLFQSGDGGSAPTISITSIVLE